MSVTTRSRPLRDVSTLEKGKPPMQTHYDGPGSERYLTPDFLRGKAEPEHALPSSNAIRVVDGEAIILWDGSNAGEVLRAREGILASTMMRVCHNSDYDTGYFYYSLKGWEDYLKGQTTGSGIPHVDKEILGTLSLFNCRKPEQIEIAKILSTVDKAIEQTEALIAKQQHIKTGLMQDLLTRGIDDVGNLRSEETHEFKDSPLGRIPVEWDIVKVKNFSKIVTGNKDTQDRNNSADYPFFVRSQHVERIESYSFDGEAVLTAGDGVGTGKVFHYINGKFDFHQRVYCMHSFGPEMDGYFFFLFFQANFMDRVARFSAKGSVDSVRIEMIADMPIPKPTLEQQQQSAAILREAETVLSEYAKSTEELKALKSALMQDLLTGKVSVTPLLTGTECRP